MITIYTSGARFGLPDLSPFVTKALVLLKMSGQPFQTAKADFRKAPKGKIPYLEDEGPKFGDSTFIRWHIESKYGVDFDKRLSAAERATAWAFEKMCENELYWAVISERWTIPENFDRGPKEFFSSMPAPLRSLVVPMVKRQIKRDLRGQGLGRHSRNDMLQIATKDIEAVADFLGTKPWLMGTEPCGADASVWSSVTGALCPQFATPLRTAAEGRANLVAYRDRGMATWFPEVAVAQTA